MDGLQPITALVTELASQGLPEYDAFRHSPSGQSEPCDSNKSDKLSDRPRSGHSDVCPSLFYPVILSLLLSPFCHVNTPNGLSSKGRGFGTSTHVEKIPPFSEKMISSGGRWSFVSFRLRTEDVQRSNDKPNHCCSFCCCLSCDAEAFQSKIITSWLRICLKHRNVMIFA